MGTEDTSNRILSLPNEEMCMKRPITFTYNDHGYFYSGDVEAHAEDKVDWLEARNICREYCMDLAYIWTSGRLCNFKGCDRDDLQPVNVNGWFWSGSGVKMAQPDNAEFEINGSVEACMGILNDIYQDGVVWHDIACYHTKPYVCEDSDQLLDFVRL